jgi:PilZ domain
LGDVPMKHDNPDDGRLKRRGPRIVGPFKGRWCGALIVPLVVHDLSVGGCLILSSNTTLPGGRMTLEIDLPGGEIVRVQAEPLYVRRNVGFAVRFVDVPDAVDMRLQRLMRELAATGGKPRPST